MSAGAGLTLIASCIGPIVQAAATGMPIGRCKPVFQSSAQLQLAAGYTEAMRVPDSPSMRERQANPRALRVEPLCKESGRLQGSWPLAALTRLAEGVVAAADGSVRWALEGSTKQPAGSAVQLWVHLTAQAVVPLQCQRCLGPLAQHLHVDRSIRFVHGEDLAAKLDEETEDDVMSLPAALDVQDLVEDELILALPIVPRHEDACPQPLASEAVQTIAEAVPASKQPHPFAALAVLKRGDKVP